MNLLRDILAHRELLQNLVARDIKSRYKGSALGFLWSILNPLFMAVIYIFFLRLLAGRGVPHEDVIIGVFAWQFTVQCVTGGMTCITGNSNLVKKVYFPRVLLPISVVVANLINFLLTLAVQLVLVAVLLAMKGSHLAGWTAALPAIIVYHSLFNLSLALLVAAANVYFRDTQHLVGLLLSAWFFVSPVMYNLSFVEKFAGPALTPAYLLNPVALIITAYRAAQVPGALFPWSWSAAGAWVWPLALLVLAWRIFQRAQRNFADWL
ncbi:MAG: ABC transporter permease [Verrucomicrobia bacterium]|nr:ABC transporter permease [Verrucomicrobiota bacterium]MBU1909573.1 ABC transporter permease [Verrucomicrobiota bacterium]